jgi:hypothetical protein
LSCGEVHDDEDPCLGQPLCPQCFDHEGAVVWNNALSELWRRTSIYLPQILARLTGMTQKAAPGARQLRQGLRVPAARAHPPARRHPA